MRGMNMVGDRMGMAGLSDRASTISAANGGAVGVEVRFEWVRGQSKRLDRRGSKRRSTGQAVLGKRYSGSVNEDTQTQLTTRRSRQSIDNGGGAREKNGSQIRRSVVENDAPRRSVESRRSGDGALRDSRTNSITSTSLSDEAKIAIRKGTLEEEEEEESDPEDSETPWACTLIVSSIPSNTSTLWENEHGGSAGPKKSPSRHSHISVTEPPASSATNVSGPNHGPTSTSSPHKPRQEVPGTLIKLKVGALSPAPHHPKVVAQLKVPFPLPDIEIESARVRRRVVTPAGVSRPATSTEADRPGTRNGNGGGGGGNSSFGGGGEKTPECTVLTAEEIKDVLSCTAFWVVVREGLGGVGKDKRKGDGWRIRG
jgi:hypothetical protein